jgi:hypothetical protein
MRLSMTVGSSHIAKNKCPLHWGLSYDNNLPQPDTLALLDRKTRQVTPFLFDPDGNLYQGHFSHDGAWVTFHSVRSQHSQVYVAPFSPARFLSGIGFPLRMRHMG